MDRQTLDVDVPLGSAGHQQQVRRPRTGTSLGSEAELDVEVPAGGYGCEKRLLG